MKLFFATLIALTTLSSFEAKAQDISFSAAVTNAFSNSFKDATDIQWSQVGNHYKAEFYLNGQAVTAFYDQGANLVGVTRNVSSVQLPVPLQTSLKASYEDYWISELFELSNSHGTNYFATVENSDTKITLKSVAGQWSVYKKIRKS